MSVGLPPWASLLGGMVAHECKHWADVLGIISAMGSPLPNVNCTSGQIQHAESAVLADSAKVKKMIWPIWCHNEVGQIWQNMPPGAHSII